MTDYNLFYENVTVLNYHTPDNKLTLEQCYDIHFVFEQEPIILIVMSLIMISIIFLITNFNDYIKLSDKLKIILVEGLIIVSLFFQAAYLWYVLIKI